MDLYQQLQQQPFVIAGPCVIESEDLLKQVAEKLKEIETRLGFTFIFKASFDKANRTAVSSFRGPGLEEGLRMLENIKKEFELPILTDIHNAKQAAPTAQVADILQIPAFLCRQTDLLLAAGRAGAIVNIKKAQFLSGEDMKYVIKKVESTGNFKLMLTERGTMFGYNNLVVDYTGVLDMMQYGYPVIMDATHSVQKPGGANGKTGGNRAYAPLLAQAAAAIGVRGFFIETHPDPTQAKSDGANMIYLEKLETVLTNIEKICTLKLNPTH